MNQYNESIESFGHYLKREREMREIGLDEIAAFTRIKLKALEAIEKDDFASLPPLAFVRAFIRCYSDYIGLNIQDVMLRFDTFVQNRYPELTGEVTIVPRVSRPKQRYLPVALGVAFVLAVILIFWWMKSPASSESKTPKPPPAETSLESEASRPPPTHEFLSSGGGERSGSDEGLDGETAPGEDEESAEAAAEPPPSNEPEEPVVLYSLGGEMLGPPAELAQNRTPEQPEIAEAPDYQPYPSVSQRVTITVDEKCWIQFFNDSDDPRQTVLLPEQHSYTFEGVSSIRIKVGNPDGVESITYNERPYTPDWACSWWLVFPPEPDRACAENQ